MDLSNATHGMDTGVELTDLDSTQQRRFRREKRILSKVP
jgi:hypothetical protein